MEKFSTLFGLELSHVIFSGTEQLFLSLQRKDTTIQEAVTVASVAIQHLEGLRKDEVFDQFYAKVVEKATDLTAPPVLPRFRRPPKKPGDNSAQSYEFTDPASYFQKKYYETLNLLISELKRRFEQKRGLPIVALIEKVLLSAANGQLASSDALSDELKVYENDINLPRLSIQLQMLPDLIRTRNRMGTTAIPIKEVTNLRTLCDIINELSISKEMFLEVIRFLKIFYTLPVTTSTTECTFSALRRLKTFLRSTMSQERLNSTMMLFVHKERTDEIVTENIAREFIMENERRRRYFGHL